MPKQKPNLFEFAAGIMTEPSTRAAKIVGCQIGYAGLLGAPLDRVPDDVGRHAILLPLSLSRNSSEYSPLTHGRMLEPCIQKLR